jgi:hypothetical protein
MRVEPEEMLEEQRIPALGRVEDAEQCLHGSRAFGECACFRTDLSVNHTTIIILVKTRRTKFLGKIAARE